MTSPTNPTPTEPAEVLVSPTIPAKKNNPILIVSVLLLGLLILFIALFLFYKYEKPEAEEGVVPTLQVNPTEVVEPTIDVSPATESGEVGWKEESFEMSNYIKGDEPQGSPEKLSVNLDRPSDWRFEYAVNDDGCDDIVLSDDLGTISLNMTIICTSWSAESNYINWPEGAVIVNTLTDQGNDSHESYNLRYTDNNDKIVYTIAMSPRGEELRIDENTDVLDNVLFVNFPNGEYDWYFKPLTVSVDYMGDANELENKLAQTDQIIKSLELSDK